MESLVPDLRKLGPLQTFREGSADYQGRWFQEYETEEQRDAMPWASLSNPSSLWLTRPSLFRSIQASGFDLVYEQVDYWLSIYEKIVRQYPRSLFIGAKSAALR